MEDKALLQVLNRIADALERQLPIAPPVPDLDSAPAWIWNGATTRLEPVVRLSSVPLDILQGVGPMRDILLDNTCRFAAGKPANNALLWGARGMGKSSLVKAVFATVRETYPALTLVEIHREEIATLPALLTLLSGQEKRIILFCDDLSFERGDESYKTLKTVLDGTIAGRPEQVLVYATSNRRHLMPREMAENENRAAIHSAEGTDEKISLSDRFGLWLGFYPCGQETYLAMVDAYARHFRLKRDDLHKEALEWAATRGARSGRVAWQFITDAAGRQGKWAPEFGA